jgi:hypothetical protein
MHFPQSNPRSSHVYASRHPRPTVQEVLLSEGLTTSDKVLMRLPGPTLAIRRAAFRTITTSGRPVTIEEAAAIAGVDAETALEASELIASVGMAEIDGGTIVGMDGLSTRPTTHRMLLDGVSLWTWCAYDIVGIAAALQADAVGELRAARAGRDRDHRSRRRARAEPGDRMVASGRLLERQGRVLSERADVLPEGAPRRVALGDACGRRRIHDGRWVGRAGEDRVAGTRWVSGMAPSSSCSASEKKQHWQRGAFR